MNWIEITEENNTLSFRAAGLKEGTICRTTDGEFVMVGEMNTGYGVGDEFREEITHYTEDFVSDIDWLLNMAEADFNNMQNYE